MLRLAPDRARKCAAAQQPFAWFAYVRYWHFASVRCDAVIRPELGVKQKRLANARHVENDPERTPRTPRLLDVDGAVPPR
jgi:hypothetical protein